MHQQQQGMNAAQSQLVAAGGLGTAGAMFGRIRGGY